MKKDTNQMLIRMKKITKHSKGRMAVTTIIRTYGAMMLACCYLPFLLSTQSVFAQSSLHPTTTLTTGENYRIYPSEVTQTEVFITRSPLDDRLLFSSCNTLTFIPFFVSEGIYVTGDGGLSWSGSDTCLGEPIEFHGGDPGIAIDRDGTFILTRLGRTPFSGLYSHYSLDQGKTWSAQQVISTDDLERASLASDVVSQGAFQGRTYAVWISLAPPFPVMASYTADGARNWSAPAQVNDPDRRSAGGDVAIGPEGEIYLCWAGVTETSPFREVLVGFASSVDGAGKWTVQEEAFEVNGITGVLSEKENIRVNGLPAIAVDTTDGPRRGWIYIVTGQKDLDPSGSDPDIILYRSSDGGASWSEGIRVNQDPLDNGKIQYFPSIHVDKYGAVDILFYDDRNTTSDSVGVFLARSVDGGQSWLEYEISDHNFKPEPIGGLGQGYQGDNIDLTSNASGIWPVWMDNSTGNYQIWTAPVAYSYLYDVKEMAGQDQVLELEQNYPNPFSSSTRISFQTKRKEHVVLRVYDLRGQLIAEPLSVTLPAGRHEVVFNRDMLNEESRNRRQTNNGGIYYYELQAGGFKAARKMILLP